jgi:hypothetical protein
MTDTPRTDLRAAVPDDIRGRDSRAKNPAATWAVQDRRDLLAIIDAHRCIPDELDVDRYECGTCGDSSLTIDGVTSSWVITCGNGHELVPSGIVYRIGYARTPPSDTPK